jgi:outer membrane biosynthesis protein TonB
VLDGAGSSSKKWRRSLEMKPEPVFPQALIDGGVTSGRVNVAIVVSADGSLRDWVITEATYREMANSVDRVIEKWDFEGLRSLNEPNAEAFYLKIFFESGGAALQTSTPLDMSRHVFGRTENLFPHGIRMASASELDALPTPIRAEFPIIPEELLIEKGRQVAVFEFFINVDGSVHIPLLKSGETALDERILLASQNALWKWKFYPPTAKGRPVVVKVAQPLVFSSEKKSPKE